MRGYYISTWWEDHQKQQWGIGDNELAHLGMKHLEELCPFFVLHPRVVI